MAFPTEYAQIITDENTTLVTYVGYNMDAFAAQGDASWAIYRITSASASSPTGVTVIEGAKGLGVFENVWSDRTGLTYNP